MNRAIWPFIKACRTAGWLDTAGKFAGAALGLYSIALLVGTIWPFDFQFDPTSLEKKLATVEWIPFTYRCPECDFDLRDKALNLAMFIPFGFLWRFREREGTSRDRLFLPLTWGFLFSLGIETAQLLLPERTTQASDLALNTAGAFLGATSYLLMKGRPCRKEGTALSAI